jgi:hypothetical protein
VSAGDENICTCSEKILEKWGISFYKWMESNLNQGLTLKDFSEFKPPKVELCSESSFKPGTKPELSKLLHEKFKQYTLVSYNLWIVVNLLANLRNTYPGATLHDCDDGSDQNPVRLNNTALGNYPLRRQLE